MQTILLVITCLGFVGALVLLYIMYQKFVQIQQPKVGEQNMFLLLQQQMQELNKTMDQKLSDTHKVLGENQQTINKTMQSQFAQSSKIITDITEKLTSLDKTNQQVIGFSAQLSNLEKVLKSQKQRGNLGEAGLKMVLENMMPPGSFQLQYEFPDGDTVDALIITKEGNNLKYLFAGIAIAAAVFTKQSFGYFVIATLAFMLFYRNRKVIAHYIIGGALFTLLMTMFL